MAETLAAEADTLTSAGKAVTDRLGCELLLLTGRPEPAIAALTTAEPLGWHRASHPGPVVLPFLWAAAIGRPPDADDGHLGEMFTAIDRDPDALPRFEDWHTPGLDPALAADQPEPAVPSCLTGLLADVLPHPGDDADRAQWIATAAAVVDASNPRDRVRETPPRLRPRRRPWPSPTPKPSQPSDALPTPTTTSPRSAPGSPATSPFRGELDAAARTSTLTTRPTPRR